VRKSPRWKRGPQDPLELFTGLDIGRQPVWPRFYETFGEDPYLAKVMGVAFVRGMEDRMSDRRTTWLPA